MNAQIQENIDAGRFVIISLTDISEPWFWSNSEGWTPFLADALFFDQGELTVNLPMEGAWLPVSRAAKLDGAITE